MPPAAWRDTTRIVPARGSLPVQPWPDRLARLMARGAGALPLPGKVSTAGLCVAAVLTEESELPDQAGDR